MKSRVSHGQQAKSGEWISDELASELELKRERARNYISSRAGVGSMRQRPSSAPGLSTPGRLFVFARHAESEANIAHALSSDPARPVALTEHGRQQARELGAQLTNLDVDLAVATRFLRTQQTIEIALRGRQVPILIEPGFDEINAGDFDGAPIETYWSWKDGHTSDENFPGGESEDATLLRYADALQRLLGRTEPVTLVVTHEHALRSIATAADHDPSSLGPDTAPANAVPYSFDERALRRARTGLLARVPPTVRPQMEPGSMSGLAA
jgi:broad specificity phosphatase PhoE